ncbi:ABC transporter ATP-binding protein [Catalinimonas niigatensis]|uniref:ABC transporter ATP-binding protein n=1 Tax=Catalinimonas niigatensis TaxID=1397264 RepID=UPI0026665983|nr:ABC transporter ATP-binding protein [Catalinimonas niigatensis]WPP52909.1 ABC transporter ATP-binding protein [Catalinimonas niigatensis]
MKNFIKKYFKSFAYFYQRLRYRIFIRMGLSISVGVLDSFGLAMFLPLLQMVDDSSSVNSEALGKLGFLINGMENMGLNLNLLTILLVMSVFFVLKGLVQYLNGLYEVNLRHYFVKTIRVGLSNALTMMSYKAFVMSDAGRIQNTMSGEVSKVSLAYQNYFGAFQQMVMVIVYMLFAFFIDAKFALLICIGGGGTNFIYNRLYEATKISSRELTIGRNHYQGLILQFVSNFKYLKATGYIKQYNDKLKDTIYLIEESNQKIGKLASIVSAIREPILILVVSTVILIQVNLLDGTLGTILISLLFFYRALSAMILLQTHYNRFLEVSGSMENMTSFEEELEMAKESGGKTKFEKFTNSIELKGVKFDYADQVILRDINLKIYKNQTVAFVGESGSGKTTLINILSGLMPVSAGSIEVDGIDSKSLNTISFQKRIGYITQEPVVFNDTIFNNVSFWAEPTPENYARYERAIHQASIKAFIEELPEKENTLLGNNGINLSGGQKQRISIARELYKDVDILVLDEATSALDSETEEAIQKGLEELQGKYTILIVAHRLSTIKNADRILVMSKGEIVEGGRFSELVRNSSKFQKMVELQEV